MIIINNIYIYIYYDRYLYHIIIFISIVYWKWPFIVDVPIKKWWFSIVMLNINIYCILLYNKSPGWFLLIFFVAPPGGPEDASSPVSAKCMEGGGLREIHGEIHGKTWEKMGKWWENPLETWWNRKMMGKSIGKWWTSLDNGKIRWHH